MPTFAHWAREEVDRRAIGRRTRETYESQLRKHIVPTFGDRLLTEIRPVDVVRWHGDLRRSGLSEDAVASNYRLLRSILRRAVEAELIERNPARIDGASAVPSHNIVIPTIEEVEAIASALPPELELFPWLGALSGLRRAESFALRVADVELNFGEHAGLLRVERQLQWPRGGGPEFTPPKTAAGRRMVTVPLDLVERLGRHIEEHVGDDPSALLLSRPGGRPMQYPWFYRRWEQALASAGLERRIRVHDLRHFAATLMAEAGASQRALMTQLGHSTGHMSLRYMHLTAEHHAELASAMSERLAKSRPSAA